MGVRHRATAERVGTPEVERWSARHDRSEEFAAATVVRFASHEGRA